MAFAAIAGLLGAGAGLYGAKKNADATKDIAKQSNPYDLARASFQTNSVNRYTPFGSVEYSIDEGKPNDPSDDSYSMRQQYSPQMQQLMDAMLGRAGAAPATFQSNMPEGLRTKMEGVFGSPVERSTYTPSVQGFGQDRRPGAGQVMEGFNYKNYDEQGNKIADEPYQPIDLSPDTFRGAGDTGLRVTAGETTNSQILDQLYNLGHIDEYDYSSMSDAFSNGGSGNTTSWSNGLPASEMEKWLDMQGDLHPRFRQTQQNIFSAIAQNNPNTNPDMRLPGSEPPPTNYDQQSLQALIQAMTAQGGV